MSRSKADAVWLLLAVAIIWKDVHKLLLGVKYKYVINVAEIYFWFMAINENLACKQVA